MGKSKVGASAHEDSAEERPAQTPATRDSNEPPRSANEGSHEREPESPPGARESEGASAVKLTAPVEELLGTLEQLIHSLDGAAGASSPDLQTQVRTLLRRIETVGHSYEVVVWGVFMPHLLRNAPALAPATVVELQENHQTEKKCLEVLYVHSNAESVEGEFALDQLQSNARELRTVLSKTERLLKNDVWAAFSELPADQQAALEKVVDHELRRQEGEDVQPNRSLFVAADVLEAERPTIPILRPPHAEA